MDKLLESREIINEVDPQIVALFVRRMEAVKQIALYKQERGIPILDVGRERVVIERNSALIEDEDIKSYFVSLMQDILGISKQYQHRLMEGMNVAYSGVEGAFADIASRKIFPYGRHTGYSGFEAAYNAVVNGECDCAVLPFENSYAGVVDKVIDLMFTGSLYVNGVYRLSVVQNLLGVKGAKKSEIKRVISHPQALSQCETYITKHGYATESTVNTAVAAQQIAELNDPTVAAIASAETADLYGLEILERKINETNNNTTKFAVFSRTENLMGDKRGKFIMMFTLNDETGALSRAIKVISDHGFNMRVLRSHPLKGKNWQYYFYIEADGDETSENGQRMIKELSEQCSNLKIVGHFNQDIEL